MTKADLRPALPRGLIPKIEYLKTLLGLPSYSQVIIYLINLAHERLKVSVELTPGAQAASLNGQPAPTGIHSSNSFSPTNAAESVQALPESVAPAPNQLPQPDNDDHDVLLKHLGSQ